MEDFKLKIRRKNDEIIDCVFVDKTNNDAPLDCTGWDLWFTAKVHADTKDDADDAKAKIQIQLAEVNAALGQFTLTFTSENSNVPSRDYDADFLRIQGTDRDNFLTGTLTVQPIVAERDE